MPLWNDDEKPKLNLGNSRGSAAKGLVDEFYENPTLEMGSGVSLLEGIVLIQDLF
jgi:hypothetical protein